jgi:hypothetical protein
MAETATSLVKSPLSRIVMGGATSLSLVLFAGAWIGTLVTAGYSLADAHTFSSWTYFPMFWPHLAAATLGFMIFLRYGANWGTGLAAMFLWLIALFSDLLGTILYWRLGWMCNISGSGGLSALEQEMCSRENALIITLWVVSTILWIVSIVAAVAQGFDLFNAGKSGKIMPGTKITIPVVLLGFFGVACAVLFTTLWLMNVVTTIDSIANIQTYGVWAHINLFSVQLAAIVISIMMALRYGNNWITAAAAIILAVLAFFSSFYGLLVYWQMGWFCFVSEGSPLIGIDLIVCNREENWLITVWILISLLWGFQIIVAIAHAVDFMDAGRTGGSMNPLKGKGSDYEELGLDDDDLGGGDDVNMDEEIGGADILGRYPRSHPLPSGAPLPNGRTLAIAGGNTHNQRNKLLTGRGQGAGPLVSATTRHRGASTLKRR